MDGHVMTEVPAGTVRKNYAFTASGPIHYAEAGEGPPLILLHETPRTHRQFARMMPVLARHFWTIAIDTPGFGNSHPLPDPVTIEAFAACVVGFMDALGLPSAHMLGVNTGNKIGAALAARWPARVERLVLAGYTHSIIPEHAARNAAIQPVFDRYEQHFAVHADGSHLVRQWLAAHATASGIWWPPRLLTGAEIRPDEIEDAEAWVSDYLLGWRNTVPVYHAVFAFDLGAAFAAIRAPTLILEWSTPQEAHLGAQARRVCATMQAGTSETLNVTYGSAPQTEAEPIASAAIRFLGG